jgi:hypothetical protein
MSPNPNTAATIAMMKKTSAQRSIVALSTSKKAGQSAPFNRSADLARFNS